MPRVRKPRRIRETHVYVPQSGAWPSDAPCTCERPKAWRGHDVPDTPPEAAVIDARILGETQEQHQNGDPS